MKNEKYLSIHINIGTQTNSVFDLTTFVELVGQPGKATEHDMQIFCFPFGFIRIKKKWCETGAELVEFSDNSDAFKDRETETAIDKKKWCLRDFSV